MSLRLIFIFLFLCMARLHSQDADLYMPLEIKDAYKKATRQMDGKPGPEYWINKAEYKIKASIDPASRTLTGEETITYYNNSPDKLYEIVLRIYQDFYKKGNRRDYYISGRAVTDGVDISKIIVDGEKIDPSSNPKLIQRKGTNIKIQLLDPLRPDEKIKLEINWSFLIPDTSQLRMGAYDPTSFFISTWYPQVSVYDDIYGWDEFDYTGRAEFYNDYSDFDVEITMPKEYVVWATGTFLNPEEVLNEDYLKKYYEAQKTEDVINVISPDDIAKKNTTKKEYNTWKYKAEHVPDFAFATSDHYLWDLTSVVVNDETKRRVITGAAYNKESNDFYEVAAIARDAVRMLSRDLPGVEFPYPNVTVFKGGGSGMEFPMLINDNTKPTREETVGVTVHELVHQYFPFYVGTNERRYSWMDEGWARMLQFDVQKAIEPSSTKKEKTVIRYNRIAGTQVEIPPIVSSITIKETLPYIVHSYSRPGMAYETLRHYLGKDVFRKALQEYINRWNGKHPTPYDFFFTFNEVTGEDLNWFWKPWFFEYGYPDLGIKEVLLEGDNTIVVVKKEGNIPIPVVINVYYTDGKEETFHKGIEVWKGVAKETKINIGKGEGISQIYLGNEIIPDPNSNNDFYFTEKE